VPHAGGCGGRFLPVVVDPADALKPFAPPAGALLRGI